ncbi:hypothetical protein [Maioricimonas sp. JC845]|uniref:hypothetical protein n=1 Tax=Maioricimonas sp. JC845 TaxID=3232138 RepID=UPI0034588042
MRTAAFVSVFLLVAAVVTSLAVVASDAQRRQAVSERLRAEAARREAEAAHKYEEAARIEAEVRQNRVLRTTRELLGREARNVELRIANLERHLAELEETGADERERDEVRSEIERERDLLHEIEHRREQHGHNGVDEDAHHEDGHHDGHDLAEHFEGRMHHLQAAIEHLEHIGMQDVVKELRHRAEAMETEFHHSREERERDRARRHEREQAERHERQHDEMARALEELRDTVERLNEQMADLRERLEERERAAERL